MTEVTNLMPTARWVTIVAAFAGGWFIYMIAMAMTVYDGLLSGIAQSFMAAFFSGIAVCLALALGLLLRVPSIERNWKQTTVWPARLAGLGLFGLMLGKWFGIALLTASWFTIIFSLTNWPVKQASRP